MPRASAADAAATARRVLDRARDLFAEHGHAGVSLDDVATAAGVTRGAVYHHYGSRSGIFRAVAEDLQQDVADRVATAAAAAGDDARDRLRAGSHAFLDAVTEGPTARVLLVDAPAVIGWDAWRDLDAAASGAHLVDALREVGTDRADLEALAAQLSGAMNEAALWLVRDHTPARRAAAHRVLDRLLDAAT